MYCLVGKISDVYSDPPPLHVQLFVTQLGFFPGQQEVPPGLLSTRELPHGDAVLLVDVV